RSVWSAAAGERKRSPTRARLTISAVVAAGTRSKMSRRSTSRSSKRRRRKRPRRRAPNSPSQSLSQESVELRLNDPLEAHPVAGSQWEITFGDVDQLQRSPPDDVPAARPGFGVDAGLPAGQ